MSSFLPSEVSRLVLGYLEEVECKTAYQVFLSECPHLAECRGRVFTTQIMGYSLVEILDDFCAAQTYLIEISKGDDQLKRKALKCKTLLDKVRLFVGQDCALKQTPAVKISHKQTSPVAKLSQSYSVHKSKRVRSNSCDSVVSTRTDTSGRDGRPLTERRQPHTRSVESLAEATNLADLPGNKRYSTTCQTKSYSNSSMYKTIAQAFKEGLNKSLDKAFRSGKYESDEENFRSALGLVRHSDLPERLNISSIKGPLKGKATSRKQGMSVKKIPHVPDPIPNETLNVTNITHALLDCTEFHEKLAENINKIYSNLSSNRIGDEVNNASVLHKNSADSVVKEDTITTNDGALPVDAGAVVNADEITADEVPQLDTVIKSIVEKTEQDPIFDQLMNEVLAATVESSSDSDVISRPGTSTPEKSSVSQMNESSPTHWRLQDTADHQIEKHNMRFGGKKIHMNYKEKMRSRRLSPFKHQLYSQSQYYSRNKKYTRYPRGGKRMDLLRETYGSSFCENDDDIPTSQQNKTSVMTEMTIDSPLKMTKTEPKVVILSDEIISTTIKPCKTPLVIDNLPRKEIPHIVSVSKPEETFIKPCKDSGISSDTLILPLATDTDCGKYYNNPPVSQIQPYADSRLQNRQMKYNEQPNHTNGFEDGNTGSNNSLQNVVNPTSNSVRYVNNEQNKTIPLLEVLPQVVNLQANNATTSDSSVSSQIHNNQKCNLRKYRKNLKNPGEDDKSNSFYSEADIMKMPTVFMGPTNNIEGPESYVPATGTDVNLTSSSFTMKQSTEVQLQQNMELLTDVDAAASNTLSHQKAKLVYREKIPLKNVHGLISSMVHDTTGTHVLQIDRSLMGILPDSGDPALSSQNELILATQNEPLVESHKVVGVVTSDTKDIGSANLRSQVKDGGKDGDLPDGKTPNDLIVEKNGASTPRRSLSHVRVLDFNTPPKSFTEARRAHSSPKMSTRSMTGTTLKPFLTPSTSSKPKSKVVKSKLFPVITEESAEDKLPLSVQESGCVKIEVLASGVWDEVHGVGQILKKSATSSDARNSKAKDKCLDSNLVNKNEKPTTQNNPSSKKKIKVMKPVDKESKVMKSVEKVTKPVAKVTKSVKQESKATREEIDEKEFEEEAAAIEWARIRNANKKSWDQEMRLMLASNPAREPFCKKKKRKITNIRNVCINLDDSDEMSKSTEDEARLLEDALNRTTGLTPAKPYETNDKSLDSIKINEEHKTDVEDHVDDNNLPSENNSSQGEIKCDETNNKDYLLQVKLFRDSMKSQNQEACKFVTYSNPHLPQSSEKKQKKTTKNKSTFKVKFTPKHSKDVHADEDGDVDEEIDVVADDSNKETADSRVPEIIVTNDQQEPEKVIPSPPVNMPIISSQVANLPSSSAPSISAPVANIVPETAKKEALLTPVEPPVPSVKITPDMPREHDFNPLNAKCNLNLLLETPFKFEILDLHMDTPKFISPGFFNNSYSSIKISDIPTPNFPFLPELTKTPVTVGKEPTPGSYSSRPTDYSSSSSYYKPDEIEFNLDVKAQRCKSPPKSLSVVKEESESSPGSEEVSQRVLRPRRSRTIYYPDSVPKSKNDKNNSANNSLNKSGGKTNTLNTTAPSKENIPKVQSKVNILPKVTPNKTSDESKEMSSKKNSSKFVDDLSLSTSSSSSESFMDDESDKLSAKIKSTSTPNVNGEKRKSEESRKQLEEKRKRVLSKLKNPTAFKRFSHTKTKVSIKGKRVPNKLSLSRKSISPAVVKTNKLLDASTSSNDKEVKRDVIVVAKENSAPVQPVKTISSKSRRKSSTPRKLMQSEIASLISPSESISDSDHHLEKVTDEMETNVNVEIPKNVESEESKTEDKSEVPPAGDPLAGAEIVSKVSPAVDPLAGAEIVSNEDSSKISDKPIQEDLNAVDNKTVVDNSSSNIDVVDDEYVSLHLSSDEMDIEPPAQILLPESKPSIDSYDINQIKEFIATSSQKVDNTAFKENFLKQGFDKKSAEAIEMELIGTPSSDIFGVDESNKDPLELTEQKLDDNKSTDLKETNDKGLNEQSTAEKEKCDVVKAAKSVDEKRTSKSNKHSSQDKTTKESTHKSSKDRHKSHYRPVSSKKSPHKSLVTSKKSPHKGLVTSKKSPHKGLVTSIKSPHKSLATKKSPYKNLVTSKKSPHKGFVNSKKSPHKSLATSKKSPHKRSVTSKKSPRKSSVTSEESLHKTPMVSKESPHESLVTSKKSPRKSSVTSEQSLHKTPMVCEESPHESLVTSKKSPQESSVTSNESLRKSPDSKKHTSQKSKPKLSLSEYNERRKLHSSKERKEERSRADSESKGNSHKDKETIENVTTEVNKNLPEIKSELKGKDISANSKSVESHATEETSVSDSTNSAPSNVKPPAVNLPVVSPSTSNRIDEEIPKASDSQAEEDEIVVWTDFDCNETSNNFFQYQNFGPRTTKQRKTAKPMDISHFKIKATVFNSLTEDEEVRDIKITEDNNLFSIPPDKLKLAKVRRREARLKKDLEKEKTECEKVKPVKKKHPLERLFDEMAESQSSLNSLEEIHDPKIIAETNTAVNSILVEESSNNAFFCSPTKYNSDPVNTNERIASMCDVLKKNIIDDKTPDKIVNEDIKVDTSETTPKDLSQSKNITVNTELKSDVKTKHVESPTIHKESTLVKNVESILEKRLTFVDVRKDLDNVYDEPSVKDSSAAEMILKSTEDLMNFAVVKSVDINKVFKSNESESGVPSASCSRAGVAEKRKRDDAPDSLNVKKNRLNSPQSLLKKIDIDAVLSKLHGPE